MQLNFKTFGQGFPVIILHGLLGSLDNWQTIAKKLSEKFQVFIIDQRNHGKSPHSDEFNYSILSNDLLDFFLQHQIEKAHLIGHSMGGKAVMNFALEHSQRVGKLIVVDIAPSFYDDRHSEVFEALFSADVKSATLRAGVEKMLRDKLNNDETTVQFLLKGLNRDKTGTHFEWKFNLESLYKHYTEISGAITSIKPFSGEALFIKGEKSLYINAENYLSIQQLFPDNKLVEIKGAGHWVHAEKPQQFTEEVIRFLS